MLTLSEERKFHLIFAHGNESSWERKYQGAKVPCMELSLLEAKVRGNESSCYRSCVLCLRSSDSTELFRHNSSKVGMRWLIRL